MIGRASADFPGSSRGRGRGREGSPRRVFPSCLPHRARVRRPIGGARTGREERHPTQQQVGQAKPKCRAPGRPRSAEPPSRLSSGNPRSSATAPVRGRPEARGSRYGFRVPDNGFGFARRRTAWHRASPWRVARSVCRASSRNQARCCAAMLPSHSGSAALRQPCCMGGRGRRTYAPAKCRRSASRLSGVGGRPRSRARSRFGISFLRTTSMPWRLA